MWQPGTRGGNLVCAVEMNKGVGQCRRLLWFTDGMEIHKCHTSAVYLNPSVIFNLV